MAYPLEISKDFNATNKNISKFATKLANFQDKNFPIYISTKLPSLTDYQ